MAPMAHRIPLLIPLLIDLVTSTELSFIVLVRVSNFVRNSFMMRHKS